MLLHSKIDDDIFISAEAIKQGWTCGLQLCIDVAWASGKCPCAAETTKGCFYGDRGRAHQNTTCLRASGRRRYFVKPSLIGWAQA